MQTEFYNSVRYCIIAAREFSGGEILTQRPSIIPLGNPFSQPLGAFQGRTERLSGAAVAQPLSNADPTIRTSRKKQVIGLMNRTGFTTQDGRG